MRASATLRRPGPSPTEALRAPARERPPLGIASLEFVRACETPAGGRGYWMALRGVDVLGMLTGGIIGFFWHPPAALLAMLVAGLVSRAETP
jgi:hypothetical protein